MTDAITLVQGDTAPTLQITLTDDATGNPISVSDSNDVVRLYFRKKGQTTLTSTIVGIKPNGGADGVVYFNWDSSALADSGRYEGEVEITFANGRIQTVYEKLAFKVRDEIG